MDRGIIMANNSISDIDKLMMIFEIEKESMKKDYPELYYAILAIKDDIKSGYKFVK